MRVSDSQPDEQDLSAPAAERVWVLDDPRAGTAAQARLAVINKAAKQINELREVRGFISW